MCRRNVRIDSRVDLSRLYGPGILTFNTGHEVALTTPADPETLDQMFFADLAYAVEKVELQDMSVCGSSVFLSQNVRNPGWSEKSVVRVSEYAFQGFADKRPEFRIETDADQLAPESTAAFLGLGHGQGCQAVREEADRDLHDKRSFSWLSCRERRYPDPVARKRYLESDFLRPEHRRATSIRWGCRRMANTCSGSCRDHRL